MPAKIWIPGRWEIPIYSAHNIRVHAKNECSVVAVDYNLLTENVYTWVRPDLPKWVVFQACRSAIYNGAYIKRIFIVPEGSFSDEQFLLVLTAQFTVNIHLKVFPLEAYKKMGKTIIPDFAMILGPSGIRTGRLIRGIQWTPGTSGHNIILPGKDSEYRQLFEELWELSKSNDYYQTLKNFKAYSKSINIDELITTWKDALDRLFGKQKDGLRIADWEKQSREILSQ